MHVYLVQHGQSKSEEEDPQRGLTDKGMSEVQKVADFLRPLEFEVDAVWHSGKARAQQTTELLARAISLLRIASYSAKVLDQKTRLPQRNKRSKEPAAT